jgi:hypothetical protein
MKSLANYFLNFLVTDRKDIYYCQQLSVLKVRNAKFERRVDEPVRPLAEPGLTGAELLTIAELVNGF